MHELSIALSLVDAVCEELPKLGDGVRPQRVLVRVGAKSGVASEALAFAFEIAVDGTPIAGIQLSIESSPGSELQLIGLEVVDDPADRRSPEEHPEEERRAGSGAA